MSDRHVPPFARVPYEAFSRESVVAVALREWRLFGAPLNDDTVVDEAGHDSISPPRKLEREPGLWQRVGEYWWLGLDADAPEVSWTGKHDATGKVFPAARDGDFAWSAAFVSYVLRIAGAGSRFPYAADHAVYINAASRVARGAPEDWLVTAERPAAYSPRPGDLICFGRGSAGGLRFDDLPTPALFPAHCDIVVSTDEPGRIMVVGGNVRDAVTATFVPVTGEGRLATQEGVVLDPRYPWMAVLRLRCSSPVG